MADIVILVAYLRRLRDVGISAIFTDRHAYLTAARYSDDVADLNRIDWTILRNRDFKRDPNDLGKFERYQAEALVHEHMPGRALAGIVCYGNSQAKRIRDALDDAGITIKVVVNPNWFF